MGQNLKNSYLPHRGELRPHIWGGEPWPTYLQNDPKLERFRDFGTPILGTPTTITSVKVLDHAFTVPLMSANECCASMSTLI